MIYCISIYIDLYCNDLLNMGDLFLIYIDSYCSYY